MWVVTLCYCIMLITSTISNPLRNITQSASDDFYNALRFAFDKFMRQKTPESLEKVDPLPNTRDHTLDDIVWKHEENDDSEKKQKREDTSPDPFQPHEINHDSGLIPLYPCDKYEEESHICVNIRQIGTTLTLGVRTETHEKQSQHRIRWYRYFKHLVSQNGVQEEFTKDKVPWNINIGGESNELRISPITEIDFSYNYFVASISSVQEQEKSRKRSKDIQFIKFIIEPISIDMGILYPGEELVIYARAFMELPMNSVTLKWTLNNTEYGLPSNMKVNEDGSSVVVKELRTSVDKVLTCSVFSSKNIFLARRNFLFRKIGAANKQEHQNIPPDLKYFRKKRSLDDNEGFEDNENIYPRSRPSFPMTHQNSNLNKNYNDEGNDQLSSYHTSNRKTKFKFDDVIQPERIPRTYDQLFYSNDPQTDSNERESTNFQPNKINTYNFPRTKTFENSHQESADIYTSSRMDQNSDFVHSKYHGFPSQVDKSSVDEGLNRDYEDQSGLKDLYNRRSKKETLPNHPSLIADSSRQDQKNEITQLNDLIQQANLLVQKPTENSNSYINEATNDVHSQIYSFDDEESALIADCKNHLDCSIHATCNKISDGHNFCRCFPKYKGNGIFCWLI